jgi:large subunit ribosomal protein L29
MALPKIADIKDLSDEEVSEQIAEAKKQLFQLRFRKATRQTVKPHEFKHTRHRLAQLMTIERERQLIAARSNKAIATPDVEESATSTTVSTTDAVVTEGQE